MSLRPLQLLGLALLAPLAPLASGCGREAPEGAGASTSAASETTSTESITIGTLLSDLVDRRALSEFPAPPHLVLQSSSRAGVSMVLTERDGRREGVLLDVTGPGAIVRIACTNPAGVLRAYLDGAEQPVLAEPMAALMSGAGPVPGPLTGASSGGQVLYLPLPFAERCVLTCDEPDELDYRVCYRSWPAGTAVISATAEELAALEPELVRTGEVLLAAPRTPGAEQRFAFGGIIASTGAGGAARYTGLSNVAPDGPHAISELRITARDEDPDDAVDLEQLLRRAVLILTFDGVDTATVPLGDFFGSAPGLNPYESFAMTVDADGSMTCRFLMPYRERAFVRVESLAPEVLRIDGSVTVIPYEWTPRTLYFHAAWRSSAAVAVQPRADWILLGVTGRGVLAGDMLTVGHPEWVELPDDVMVPGAPQASWWGQGGERIRVDAERAPSHLGTGTEGYYGAGPGSPQRLQGPFQGRTRCDGPEGFGYTSLDRIRALDGVPFLARLEHGLELRHPSEGLFESLTATAWFYAGPEAAEGRADPRPAARQGVPRLTR